MPASEPKIAVVLATKDRARLLTQLLDSLRGQTLPVGEFEVVVVDDGSTDATADVLRTAGAGLALRVLRHERPLGPARARDAGWRAARAPLVVFTDDDCRATPGWLEGHLRAARAHPGAIVMGRTDPPPEERGRISPFTRQIDIARAGPPYETCNILYPRELLERLGGFDLSFPLPGGEDTDLGWRAEQAGAGCVYAPEAHTHHAVVHLGPVGALRFPLRWEKTIPVFARHPELRRVQLHRGVFWAPSHEHLLRALCALVLPRRLWPVSLLLAAPYLRRLMWRRTGPLLAPYIAACDLVELYAVVRGAVRSRVLVL